MAPHSSTLSWKIPWMEEPGRLQSMGSLRVGHDWATSLSLFTFLHWRRKWQLQCSCLENPRDGGAWWAAVYGVAQSWTGLKRLSSSSSSSLSTFKIIFFPLFFFCLVLQQLLIGHLLCVKNCAVCVFTKGHVYNWKQWWSGLWSHGVFSLTGQAIKDLSAIY